MERFIATNKQTGNVVIGSWEDVCDLDKRIWDVDRSSAYPKKQTPLAIIEVASRDTEDDILVYCYREIYSHNELVGLYI